MGEGVCLSQVPLGWGLGMPKGVGVYREGGYFQGRSGYVRGRGWVPTPLLLTPSGSHHMYGRQAGVRILLEGCFTTNCC